MAHHRRLARVTGIVMIALCTGSCDAVPAYQPVVGVAKLVVRTNLGRTLREITDAVEVAGVVTFVNGRLDGWRHSWTGVAVARVRVDMYTDPSDDQRAESKRFLGHFGASQSRLVTSREGQLASRAASDAEVREFMRLVGVPVSALERDGARGRARRDSVR